MSLFCVFFKVFARGMTSEVNDDARFRKHSRGMCLGNGMEEAQAGSAECPT